MPACSLLARLRCLRIFRPERSAIGGTAWMERALERECFVHLDGPSRRTRHLNLEEVLPAKSERLRISGTTSADLLFWAKTNATLDRQESPLKASLQLRVLRLGFLQDGDVRIGVTNVPRSTRKPRSKVSRVRINDSMTCCLTEPPAGRRAPQSATRQTHVRCADLPARNRKAGWSRRSSYVRSQS